jgi:cytochrome oxidase Cu insertion factor (SCO1/SenC/PrrC family)
MPIGRLAVACALSALLLAGCGTSSDGPPPPSRAVGTRLDAALPGRITNLPFTDSTGRTRHLSDFAGKQLVISDGMTLCQESCPLDTTSVVQTARAVSPGARPDVEFLSITVDPERDTPARLAAYRKLFEPAPPNWLLLTGTPQHVRALWKYLGVYVKRVPDDSPAPRDWLTGKPLTYDVQHSDEVFFLDGRTHERFVLSGIPHLAGRHAVPARLYAFMSDKGHHNLAHAGAMAWTPHQALRVLGWLDGRKVAA